MPGKSRETLADRKSLHPMCVYSLPGKQRKYTLFHLSSVCPALRPTISVSVLAPLALCQAQNHGDTGIAAIAGKVWEFNSWNVKDFLISGFLDRRVSSAAVRPSALDERQVCIKTLGPWSNLGTHSRQERIRATFPFWKSGLPFRLLGDVGKLDVGHFP